MQGNLMNEIWLAKLVGWIPKIIAIIASAILALVLSGDIDKKGNIKITRGLLMRVLCALSISLFGGAFIIEFYGLSKMSNLSQGFVFLLVGAFGLLIIGVIYQCVSLLHGKPLSVVTAEVSGAFKAIWGRT